MKKVLNMAKKTTDKKPRNEFIEFYVDDFEGKLELKYNFDEDSLEIENQIIDSAKVETSYKKTSGKLKRTNSTPLKSTKLPFNCDKAIFKNFDVLLAIDTNTKLISNNLVSVTSSYFVNKPISECNKTGKYPFIPFASHLFININNSINAEKLGWHTIISNYVQNHFPKNYRIGIIVDCDLGAHDSINSYKDPYFEQFYLPENIQLIYASSDTKNDSIANQMINFSDKLANNIMQSDGFSRLLEADCLMDNIKHCEKNSPIISSRPS